MTQPQRYREDGYVLLPSFVPEEVTRGFLLRLKADLARGGVKLDSLRQSSNLLARPAIEMYGYHYPPMISFLWGMTPAIAALTGCDLLPTYSYFRLYRRGDTLKVHSDRPSCEHSLSLLLASSDRLPWDLEVGAEHVAEPYALAADDFGDADHIALQMAPGDAVLYQGVHRHHGRTTPNPNRWSAHLFLHWVDRAGPYADKAFDGQMPPPTLDFEIA